MGFHQMWQEGLRNEGQLFTSDISPGISEAVTFSTGQSAWWNTWSTTDRIITALHPAWAERAESHPWGSSASLCEQMALERTAWLSTKPVCSAALDETVLPRLSRVGCGLEAEPGQGVRAETGCPGPWTGCVRTPHRSLRFHPQADWGWLNTAIQAREERWARRNLGS